MVVTKHGGSQLIVLKLKQSSTALVQVFCLVFKLVRSDTGFFRILGNYPTESEPSMGVLTIIKTFIRFWKLHFWESVEVHCEILELMKTDIIFTKALHIKRSCFVWTTFCLIAIWEPNLIYNISKWCILFLSRLDYWWWGFVGNGNMQNMNIFIRFYQAFLKTEKRLKNPLAEKLSKIWLNAWGADVLLWYAVIVSHLCHFLRL